MLDVCLLREEQATCKCLLLASAYSYTSNRLSPMPAECKQFLKRACGAYIAVLRYTSRMQLRKELTPVQCDAADMRADVCNGKCVQFFEVHRWCMQTMHIPASLFLRVCLFWRRASCIAPLSGSPRCIRSVSGAKRTMKRR